jgi:hypothetical protein
VRFAHRSSGDYEANPPLPAAVVPPVAFEPRILAPNGRGAGAVRARGERRARSKCAANETDVGGWRSQHSCFRPASDRHESALPRRSPEQTGEKEFLRAVAQHRLMPKWMLTPRRLGNKRHLRHGAERLSFATPESTASQSCFRLSRRSTRNQCGPHPRQRVIRPSAVERTSLILVQGLRDSFRFVVRHSVGACFTPPRHPCTSLPLTVSSTWRR